MKKKYSSPTITYALQKNISQNLNTDYNMFLHKINKNDGIILVDGLNLWQDDWLNY